MADEVLLTIQLDVASLAASLSTPIEGPDIRIDRVSGEILGREAGLRPLA